MFVCIANLEKEGPEAEPEKRRHKRSRKDQVILFVLLFLKKSASRVLLF